MKGEINGIARLLNSNVYGKSEFLTGNGVKVLKGELKNYLDFKYMVNKPYLDGSKAVVNTASQYEVSNRTVQNSNGNGYDVDLAIGKYLSGEATTADADLFLPGNTANRQAFLEATGERVTGYVEGTRGVFVSNNLPEYLKALEKQLLPENIADNNTYYAVEIMRDGKKVRTFHTKDSWQKASNRKENLMFSLRFYVCDSFSARASPCHTIEYN